MHAAMPEACMSRRNRYPGIKKTPDQASQEMRSLGSGNLTESQDTQLISPQIHIKLDLHFHYAFEFNILNDLHTC